MSQLYPKVSQYINIYLSLIFASYKEKKTPFKTEDGDVLVI